MKIDVHVSTRKVKSGDSVTRNIETPRWRERPARAFNFNMKN